MAKSLFISEKPSVAQEFAKALKMNGKRNDGYIETEQGIVTWCVGHLVTMSYPEAYDANLKKWSVETLPFLPEEFLYEVIPAVKKQFGIVKKLLNREDVDVIYVCTDSGREGEYIYRLVDQMAGVSKKKDKRRVWIDSQTEEEILRGIKQAKPISYYDNLSDAAYLRAKEDYLMGINFSRILTLKYGQTVMNYLNHGKWSAISVGRVMTCVLGMVVRREREIRAFVKTPFYRVIAAIGEPEHEFEGEWRAVEGSLYFNSKLLYKENGFKDRKDAESLVKKLSESSPVIALVDKIEKKKENKNPPLLFNLAELQNECSRLFKISPDDTLKIVQELYEKKLVTYPRTDARVLSEAVSKEITKNIKGLTAYPIVSAFAAEVLSNGSYKGIAKTRYVNDKQITDHYAIIPTGQGAAGAERLPVTHAKIYEIIVRRFLSIFFPAAVYQKINLITKIKEERFFSGFKILSDSGYLKVMVNSFDKRKREEQTEKQETGFENGKVDKLLWEMMKKLKKEDTLLVNNLSVKEGETSPPKRYNSGSMILAMENAGQLIEDDELRAQMKGNGIGTSATRAEILNKLVKIYYLNLNKKTQLITPTQLGEIIYDVVNASIRPLLNPELTASWEKGLNYVSEGSISKEEYMQKLESFIQRNTNGVKKLNNQGELRQRFNEAAVYYTKGKSKK